MKTTEHRLEQVRQADRTWRARNPEWSRELARRRSLAYRERKRQQAALPEDTTERPDAQ